MEKNMNENLQLNKSQIDNKFTDNMRFMIGSLLQSVNKISEINKKISLIDRVKADNKFTDNMTSVIDSLLKSVNKISEIDQKIAQIDKVTTYPYGINTFKVCGSEILSNNKLNRLDEDKNTPKDKNKDKNNSQVIRDESQALRNNSQDLEMNHKHLEMNQRHLEMNHKHLEIILK